MLQNSFNDGNQRKNGRFMRFAGPAVALGTNIAVGMGLFTFLGYYIDHKRSGGFLWTLCGMGVGMLYSGYEIWKVIKLLNSSDRNNNLSHIKQGNDGNGSENGH